ncbi:MAG: DUF72 domain-containing protein [Acidobacteriota bacterium]
MTAGASGRGAPDDPAIADSPRRRRRYRLGLPFWGLQGWVGSLYPKGSKPRDFLRHYASVFSTVEGNTTFYSLPSEATVERWCEATPESFRFCLKLPKILTHEKRLLRVEAELEHFLGRVEPLGPRLGPFIVQLPPSFGPDLLPRLDAFLTVAPSRFRYAVELRQSAFYLPPLAREVDAMLRHYGCDRCVIDTRALREGDPSHPDVQAALHKKPDLPAYEVAIGEEPIVRLICHPDFSVSEPWLERWSRRFAEWMRQGKRPHVCVHLPDNVAVPKLARRCHEILSAELGGDLPALPEFPGEIVVEPPPDPQLSLF